MENDPVNQAQNVFHEIRFRSNDSVIAILFLGLFATFAGAQQFDDERRMPPTLALVAAMEYPSESLEDWGTHAKTRQDREGLVLLEKGSLARDIAAGAWCQVDVDIQERVLATAESQTQIRFSLDGATDCLVVWDRSRFEDKFSNRLLFIDTDEEKHGEDQFLIRRIFVLPGDSSGKWRITYRYGLLSAQRLAPSKKVEPIWFGHLANGGATIRRVQLHQAVGESLLRKLSIRACRAPTRPSEQQESQLTRASQLASELVKLYNSGRFPEAAEKGRAALEIREKLLGPFHYDCITSQNNLAKTLEAASRHREADSMLDRTIKVASAVLGPKHPSLALYVSNRAELRRSLGDFKNADSLFSTAKVIRAQVYGKDHSSYATTLLGIASLRQSQGKYLEAEKVLKEAVDIYAKAQGKTKNYATAVNNLAALYHRMGRYRDAHEFYVVSAELRRELLTPAHPQYAESLNNLAANHFRLGEYKRAEELYTTARGVLAARFTAQHETSAINLNNIAALYSEMGRLEEAEKLLQQAAEIHRTLDGDKGAHYATSLVNLGAFYKSQGRYEKAEEHYHRGIQIEREIYGLDNPKYATSMHNLASLYVSIGRYQKAEKILKASGAAMRKAYTEKHPRYAASLNTLADLYQDMGDYRRAEPLLYKSLQIRQSVYGRQHSDVAASLTGLGELYYHLGDYTKAERYLLEARKIRLAVQGASHPDFARALHNLATVYASMGEQAQALAMHQEALRVNANTYGKEHPVYAAGLTNIAALYSKLGQFGEAERRFLESLRLRTKIHGVNHPSVAATLNGLAVLYSNNGQIDHAMDAATRAVAIRKEFVGAHSTAYASSLHNLAGVHEANDEFDKALELYRAAEAIYREHHGAQHPSLATILLAQTLVHQQLGNRREARSIAAKAHKIQSNVAKNAIPALSEAQSRSWLRHNAPRTDIILSLMQDDDEVEPQEVYEFVWNSKALATRFQTEAMLPDNASAGTKKIFTNLRDARLLLASLITRPTKERNQGDFRLALSDASQRKEQLEKEWANASPSSESAMAIRDATIGHLLEVLPTDSVVVDFVKLVDWSSQQSGAPMAGADHANSMKPTFTYHAFVLRSPRTLQADSGKPVEWIRLGPAAPIDSSIEAWRREFEVLSKSRGLKPKSVKRSGAKIDSNTAIATSPSERIHKLVWAKMELMLRDYRHVILIPDGALHRVPWAALPGRGKQSYLFEDYALSCATYGQQVYGVLRQQSSTPIKGATLLVADDVDYRSAPRVRDMSSPSERQDPDSDLRSTKTDSVKPVGDESRSWESLADTKQESEAIQKVWNELGEIERLRGAAATEQAVVSALPRARFAHLATHGFFEKTPDVYDVDLRSQTIFTFDSGSRLDEASVADRNPLLMSGIVLAGADAALNSGRLDPREQRIDGILTAEEIVGLDLRGLEMVALSACETGLGDVADGEGVFGLQRAFQRAGAKTVLASLWKVDSRATRLLMTEYYRNLWDRKLSRVESLRQSQLTLLKRYDLVSGELRSLKPKSVTRDRKSRLKEVNESGNRLPPVFWAAFQLSGDWR